MNVRRLAPDEGAEVLRATSLLDEPSDPDAVRAYLADPRNVFLLAYDGDRAV